LASYTENYNLKKPAGGENYNISDINGNMNIIDGKLKENADNLEAHKDSSDHDERYYTETEIDEKFETSDNNLEIHKDSNDHDERYYTETELDNGTLDNRYYTENEIDSKFATRDNNLNAHETSSTAHSSDDITNNSEVQGSKVSDAFNSLQDRVNNIVGQAGDSNTEIVDARFSETKNITYNNLTARNNAIEEVLPVNVHDFWVDDYSDWTLAIQNAIDYAHTNNMCIKLLSNTYDISDTITAYQNTVFSGTLRTASIINMTDNTKFAFEVISPPGTNISSLKFREFTLNAKYGIKINNEDIFTGVGYTLGATFKRITLKGNLDNITDPYKDTAIEPTLAELKAQGIGIQASKMFDSLIQQCQITKYGIDIYFNGCDINTIDNCRLDLSSRHYHGNRVIVGADNFGSQNKIINCDILVNHRLGGIYTEEWWSSISKNYFECQDRDSAQYIRTKGDRGITIDDNRFDNTSKPNTPIMSINCAYDDRITNNKFNPDGQVYTIEVKDDYYDKTKGIFLYCKNNGQQFPIPKFPFVITEEYNKNLIRYDNIGDLRYHSTSGTLGAGSDNFFEYNSTYGTYTIKADTPSIILTFKLQNRINRKYKVDIRARKRTLTPAANYSYTMSYSQYGLGSAVTLKSGNLPYVSANSHFEILSFPVYIPETYDLRDGKINCTIHNGDSEIESLELVPIDYIVGEKTYDPASIVNGATNLTTITVSGAKIGDKVEMVFGNLLGASLTGYVSSADTVTAIITNNTGATLDLGQTYLRAIVTSLYI